MYLPNWLKRRDKGRKTSTVEKKSQTSSVEWPLEPGSFIEYALGYGGRISPQLAMNFYRSNSTIATSVDKIASRVEQITPILKTEDGNKIINSHPLLDLLYAPNPFDTWQEFMGKLSRHYLLTHDSHVSMLGNVNLPPLEIYALKPQNVSVTAAVDYFPAAYQITVGPGIGRYLRTEEKRRIRFLDGPLKELYHIMGFSSRDDELTGDSPLEAAAMEVRQQIKGKYHNMSLLDNGGRLSLVVAFKDSDGIDDDEHKSRKKRINEDLGGSGNAGKIAVISGSEVEIKEVGVSNKDMDFVELDNLASQAIYLRYEIPLPLVSTSATTYNNYENAILDLYENTVLPLTDILLAGLTKAFSQRFDLQGMYLSYDQENIKVLMRNMLKEIQQRRDINLETVNELRSLLPNRESITGGEVLYQPATLIRVGEDSYTGDELTSDEIANILSRRAGIEDSG